MNGVTTAIVAFIFVCLALPSLVKNKSQWYAALGISLLIILVDSFNHMVGSANFGVFCYVLTGFLQAAAILILVLACGGLTVKEMAGEVGQAYEVMRRGGTREVIVPLSPDAYREVTQRYSKKPVAPEGRVYTVPDSADEDAVAPASPAAAPARAEDAAAAAAETPAVPPTPRTANTDPIPLE
jgi:hypothetical protein